MNEKQTIKELIVELQKLVDKGYGDCYWGCSHPYVTVIDNSVYHSSKGEFDTFETLDAEDFEQFEGKIDDEEPDVLLGCAQYREISHYEECEFREEEENREYDLSELRDDDKEYSVKIDMLSASDDQIQDEDPDGLHAPKLSETNWQECPYWDRIKDLFNVGDAMYTSYEIVDEIIDFNVEDDHYFHESEMKEIIDFFVDKATSRYVINDLVPNNLKNG